MPRTITALLVAALAGAGVAAAIERPPNLEDAIRAQERRTGSRPGDAGALNDLGNLLALAGETERAEEVYRRALEITPEEAILHYNLGLLLRQSGRPKAALRELKRGVKLDPNDPWAHYQLGALLEEERQRSKAIHHFTRAFVLEPELAQLDVNPQLLDSRLVTHALTLAYVERVASLESAPRQYEHPKRITRLLIPEARSRPAAGEATTEPAAEPEPRRRPKSKKKKNPTGAP